MLVGRGVLVGLACVALLVGDSGAGSGALHATSSASTLVARIMNNVRMVTCLQKIWGMGGRKLEIGLQPPLSNFPY